MDSFYIINESIICIRNLSWYDGKMSCLEGINYNGLTRRVVKNYFLCYKLNMCNREFTGIFS